MNHLLPGLIVLLVLCLIASSVALVRLYRHVHSLQSSFAKMGFVVRQDLQECFDQAAQKIIESQSQSTLQNQKIIEQTMQAVLDKSSNVVQKRLASAEKEASSIILRAHQDRQRIIDDAKLESNQYLNRLTGYSAEALEWAMEQLLKEKIDLNGHEELVKSLVSVYLDEHKRV